MAEVRHIVAVALALLALSSYLWSYSPVSKPLELAAHNATELSHKVYLGSWSAPKQAFGLLTDTSGRGYFVAEQVGSNNYTAYLLLFDGPWEDDQSYTVKIVNSEFNYTDRSLDLGHTLSVFDNTDNEGIKGNDLRRT